MQTFNFIKKICKQQKIILSYKHANYPSKYYKGDLRNHFPESCLLITAAYIHMHSRMLLSWNANTMNPDQTAPKREQSDQGS